MPQMPAPFVIGDVKSAQMSRTICCLCRERPKSYISPALSSLSIIIEAIEALLPTRPRPGTSPQSTAMALKTAAATQAVDPAQIPAMAVTLEAQRSVVAMRNRRNEMDLASMLVH